MLLLINDLTEETVIKISRYSIGLATLAGREFDKNQFTGSESDKTSYHSCRAYASNAISYGHIFIYSTNSKFFFNSY